MRTPRIYTPQSLHSSSSIKLDSGPSHHIAKVLRMQPGRELIVFNGQGGEYRAVIDDCQKKAVTVTLQSHSDPVAVSPLTVHLGIAMSKGDRFEQVVQKSTELGVTSITPLLTSRCELKLKGDRAQKKQLQWQQIAIAACEQCGRNDVPTVNAPQPLDNWIDGVEAEKKYVLHHRSEEGLAGQKAPCSVALLIGPEGGLCDDEIRRAGKQGFAQLTLGPRVLRTETAPLAALSLMQYLWGDI